MQARSRAAGDRIIRRHEIQELILRVFQERASRAERAIVEAWRRASPGNARRFHVLERIWYHSGEALDSQRIVAGADAVKGSLHAAPEQAEAPDKGRISLGFVGWAAAACLAILLAGQPVHDAPPAQVGGAPVVREITTGGTEMVTVGLEDGSVVRVAPRSRLEFRRGADRQVWLEGRAFFSVATDTALPFHVRTAGGDVAVLGTRFEVAARDRDVRVLVVEGKVELSTRGSRVELGAHAVAEALAGGPAEVHEVDDVVPHLAWLGRTLVFQNTTFRDAAREIEDRFGIPLRFQAEEIADRRITAAFTDEELDEVLRVICRAASARCTRSESSIVVAPRESTIEPGAADRFSPHVFPEERDP